MAAARGRPRGGGMNATPKDAADVIAAGGRLEACGVPMQAPSPKDSQENRSVAKAARQSRLDTTALESELVSALLHDPQLLDSVRLGPQDFVSPAAAAVFAALRALDERGEATTSLNARLELE